MEQCHRWGSLPDDILVDIISRIDLPRETTLTISSTTFDIRLYIPPTSGNKNFDISAFWILLGNLFDLFISPSINTFHLLLPYDLFESNCAPVFIDSWARQLCVCNVQNVTIALCDTPTYRPDFCAPNVFRLRSLVSLDLDFERLGFVWSVPNLIDLPNLKSLSLILVDYAVLGRFLTSCPLLEELSLIIKKPRDTSKGSISISCNNLKQLHIHSCGSNSGLETIIDAPKLELLNYKNDSFSNPSDEIMLLGSISHVKSLELDISKGVRISKSLSNTIFLNMTHLKLVMGCFERFVEFIFMFDCPNLEVFEIQATCFYRWNCNQISTLVQLLRHVKRIELHVNRLDEHILNLATYMLRSSPVLENFVLDPKGHEGKSGNIEEDLFYRSLIEDSNRSPRCQIDLVRAHDSIE